MYTGGEEPDITPSWNKVEGKKGPLTLCARNRNFGLHILLLLSLLLLLFCDKRPFPTFFFLLFFFFLGGGKGGCWALNFGMENYFGR